ncbi:unnamed protein product [Dicrocoelium dendriticum]|nr:unnamed protein product [Dicrocoelium dendriticum]
MFLSYLCQFRPAEKVLASITKPPLTPLVQPSSGEPTGAALSASASDATKSLKPPSVPTSYVPPAYRSMSMNTSSSQSGVKKKRYIRIAAGVTWEDPTLSEWDPS